ncbi:MAG: tetratricopeptide repeat protein [Actinomycetia bacterium]|nr:tetratricopeptide repeat protein [Actinomycetes bacterium]
MTGITTRYGFSRWLLCAALAGLLVTGMAACGHSSTSAATHGAKLTYKKPRDRSNFELAVSKARETAQEARKTIPQDADPEVYGIQMNAAGITGGFTEGNDLFRKGDYQGALTKYEDLLEETPYHYGALNNAALACLELEKNEEALQYALTALELYPNNPELYLNAQAATVAAGYDLKDLDGDFGSTRSHAEAVTVAASDLFSSIEYNDLCGAAAINTLASDSYTQSVGQISYENYVRKLKDLKQKDSADPDITALMKYYQGVGVLTNKVEKPASR